MDILDRIAEQARRFDLDNYNALADKALRDVLLDAAVEITQLRQFKDGRSGRTA